MKPLFIDSDIFIRDLRYPRDAKSKINRSFLTKIKKKTLRGVTSIFNLLEICGILSFNLSGQELIELYAGLTREYSVKILFPADVTGNINYDIPKIFEQIQKKQSLGDAQISFVVNRFASQLSSFVSWNAAHFKEKLALPVKTPEDFV